MERIQITPDSWLILTNPPPECCMNEKKFQFMMDRKPEIRKWFSYGREINVRRKTTIYGTYSDTIIGTEDERLTFDSVNLK